MKFSSNSGGGHATRLITPLLGVIALLAASSAHAIPIHFESSLSSLRLEPATRICTACEDIDVDFHDSIADFAPVSAGDWLEANLFTLRSDANTRGRLTARLYADLVFSTSDRGTATARAEALLTGNFNGTSRQQMALSWTTQPGSLLFDDGTLVDLQLADGNASCSSRFGAGCGSGLQLDSGTHWTASYVGDGGVDMETVPEPGVLALLGAGLLVPVVTRRRRLVRIHIPGKT